MHRTRITKHPRRARYAAMLAVAAAALSAGLAPSASAQSGFVAIIPSVAPKFDVAHGPAFPLVARDSSGISFAEQWKLEPAPDGHVYITSRLFRDGTTKMAMDVQDTVGKGPADPGEREPVGTSPFDRSATQQWKVTPVPITGRSVLVNRHNGRSLAFKGTGFAEPYEQRKTGGLVEFVIKPLG